jgi:hypothetical protein
MLLDDLESHLLSECKKEKRVLNKEQELILQLTFKNEKQTKKICQLKLQSEDDKFLISALEEENSKQSEEIESLNNDLEYLKHLLLIKEHKVEKMKQSIKENTFKKRLQRLIQKKKKK